MRPDIGQNRGDDPDPPLLYLLGRDGITMQTFARMRAIKEVTMTQENLKDYRLGWVGTGRMGYAMAARLLKNGCDVAVYNRTRAKAEPLAEFGATLVATPAELADRDIVFTMVSGPEDLIEVVTGSKGILAHGSHAPKLLVDCSSVSTEASAAVRARAAARGVAMLAAPVSGNAKVVQAGLLSV